MYLLYDKLHDATVMVMVTYTITYKGTHGYKYKNKILFI